MPKASVVALLAAGPLLLATSSIAFAQTAAKAPAADAPSPSAAPKAPKDTPQTKAREMAAMIPGAECRIVPGAGHAVPLERPEECAAWIDRFVKGAGVG